MDPLMATLVGFAGRAVSRMGGQQVADRVAILVGLQRAEIKLLKSIESDVDRLLAAPFNRAVRQIEDASQSWRTEEGAKELLLEARSSLTQALGQDKDPLRLSLAALLLAGVWNALGSPEDCPSRLLEAHSHAVDAARSVADRDPRPPWRVRKWVLGRKLTRPRSIRLLIAGYVGAAIMGDAPLLRISAYHATRPARRQEAELERLHDFVQWLRDALVELDDSNQTLSRFQPALEESYSHTVGILMFWVALSTYALKYVEVSDEADLEGRVAEILSKERASVRFELAPESWTVGDGDSRP